MSQESQLRREAHGHVLVSKKSRHKWPAFIAEADDRGILPRISRRQPGLEATALGNLREAARRSAPDRASEPRLIRGCECQRSATVRHKFQVKRLLAPVWPVPSQLAALKQFSWELGLLSGTALLRFYPIP